MNCIVTDQGGAITKALAEQGHWAAGIAGDAFDDLKKAAEKMQTVDCLIQTGYWENGADAEDDLALALDIYRRTVIPPMEAVHILLPYMEKSVEKTICFFTSAAASVNLCRSTEHYAFYMAHAALHMRVKIMHNELAAKGFRIKLIDPGSVTNVRGIVRQVCADGYTQDDDPSRNVDSQLFLTDAQGRIYPW